MSRPELERPDLWSRRLTTAQLDVVMGVAFLAAVGYVLTHL